MLTTTHINPSRNAFGERFTQYEPDAMTTEECDLLYGLVRMRKPLLSLETGIGHAGATKRIGEALLANGQGGWLLSCDTDNDYVEAAKETARGLNVEVRLCRGTAILGDTYSEKPGLILVDAGNVKNRIEELNLIVEKDVLAPKGLLVVHDALNPKYARLVDFMKSQKWSGLVMESLAGIAIFQHP